ncbi:MAG: GatB/YqeY domain-containing protein [Firmicutes bacterium]|jgi:gatB/yqey domain protein|nr:GatB/YqeY domain-containing protein [Bacillota bacterium]
MYEKINEDLKNAMKEKDTFKLSVLRMLKSALQLEQIAKKHELDDNEVAAVLKKQVKVRKDSLEEYKKYDKAELVESLEKEIAILDVYLPEEMNKEDITKVVEAAINEVKPTSMKDMGLVMKKVNELLVGKNADMSLVSKLVKEQIMPN